LQDCERRRYLAEGDKPDRICPARVRPWIPDLLVEGERQGVSSSRHMVARLEARVVEFDHRRIPKVAVRYGDDKTPDARYGAFDFSLGNLFGQHAHD
jgi:hypothetical protein